MPTSQLTALVNRIVLEGDVIDRSPFAQFWHLDGRYYILLTGEKGYRHILCHSSKLDAQL